MNAEVRRQSCYLGLDLGGTNIKGGVVDDNGQAFDPVSLSTRADLGPEIGLDTLLQVARLAVEASGVGWSRIEGVGLGSAGTIDAIEGRIIEASNLPGWAGFPLARRLAERLGKPTSLTNDANAAAFGEYWAGAGRHTENLVLFTLGTGIGSGIIDHGRIVEGHNGFGGECGHMTIQMDGGRVCSCGRLGHLEAYASATSVVQRAIEAMESGKDSSLFPEFMAGTLESEAIAQAALDGDKLAGRLMSETARYLAIGAANVMHTVDPELVLFGGGMIAAGPSFLESIREGIREHAFPAVASRTRVEFASLGGNAGFIGAAGCVRKARHQG